MSVNGPLDPEPEEYEAHAVEIGRDHVVYLSFPATVSDAEMQIETAARTNEFEHHGYSLRHTQVIAISGNPTPRAILVILHFRQIAASA